MNVNTIAKKTISFEDLNSNDAAVLKLSDEGVKYIT